MARLTNDKLVSESSLYREFLAERDEILRHKWLKSEEAGRDIGFESALVDWMLNHRSQWKKEFKRDQRQIGSGDGSVAADA